MDAQGRPGGPLRLWPSEGGPGVAQARAIGDRDVGAFIEPRPHVQTVPLQEGESCAVVLCSDGIWDALLPSAVDALVRGMMTSSAETCARIVCDSALQSRHAYSSEGDSVPIDDTTVVVMRIEHAEDSLERSNANGCGGC